MTRLGTRVLFPLLPRRMSTTKNDDADISAHNESSKPVTSTPRNESPAILTEPSADIVPDDHPSDLALASPPVPLPSPAATASPHLMEDVRMRIEIENVTAASAGNESNTFPTCDMEVSTAVNDMAPRNQNATQVPPASPATTSSIQNKVPAALGNEIESKEVEGTPQNANQGPSTSESANTNSNTDPTTTSTTTTANPTMTSAPATPNVSSATQSISTPVSLNPYSMYYPSPTTPLTPNTPTYVHPYANPYYPYQRPLCPEPQLRPAECAASAIGGTASG